jgi:serine/threonine protein kinase
MERSSQMDIDVGHVVGGKYELVRLLGRGSMGEVWSAHHRTLGEKLAVKLLTQTPSTEEELESRTTAAARFQFEAQVAARLSGKTRHIVRVTDHGEEDGLAYLVMEQLEGETLEAVLVRDTRVPIATMSKIITQVARALAHAHGEGVLHRDLKPANVFLSHDEEGKLLVKLLDFGIARAIHAHRVPGAFSTAKGLVFGTPSYMSPEQARASAKLDHRCDLWALATIAYEGLSGDLPVTGNDADELLKNLCAGKIVPLLDRSPGMPLALDAFFRRAFSDAIGARFQSATDLAQAFARAAATASDRHAATDPPGAGPPPSVVSVSSPEVTPSSRKRSVRVAVLVGGLSLLALLGVALAWRAFAGPPPEAAISPPPTPTQTLVSAPGTASRGLLVTPPHIAASPYRGDRRGSSRSAGARGHVRHVASDRCDRVGSDVRTLVRTDVRAHASDSSALIHPYTGPQEGRQEPGPVRRPRLSRSG